jgi:hypothetical protein
MAYLWQRVVFYMNTAVVGLHWYLVHAVEQQARVEDLDGRPVRHHTKHYDSLAASAWVTPPSEVPVLRTRACPASL